MRNKLTREQLIDKIVLKALARPYTRRLLLYSVPALKYRDPVYKSDFISYEELGASLERLGSRGLLRVESSRIFGTLVYQSFVGRFSDVASELSAGVQGS